MNPEEPGDVHCHFSPEEPGDEWEKELNKNSEEVVKGAMLEEGAMGAKTGDSFQLERLGYFRVDEDTTANTLVLNRTVTLSARKGK